MFIESREFNEACNKIRTVVYKEEEQQQLRCTKYNLLLFLFSFISKMLNWSRRLLKCTHRARYESSVNYFFFILLLGDWYKAISRHWSILVSPWFFTFASLIRPISRRWIIFISTHFTSSLVYIISQMSTQSSWSHLSLMHCTWTHLLSNMPPTQLMLHFHWSISLFNLGNRCPSCYSPHMTCVACQQYLSSQYWILHGKWDLNLESARTSCENFNRTHPTLL